MFPKEETFIFVNIGRAMNQKFTIKLLEEVDKFLNGLEEKAREKIIYNLRKAQIVNDNELFKKLNENV